MNKIYFVPIYLFISILLIGCSKDSSNCLFVGGLWCDSASGILCIEFRENGEYYLSGAHGYDWKAKDDCKTIELNVIPLQVKVLEYKVVSITGNSKGSKMILEQSGNRSEYTKQ